MTTWLLLACSGASVDAPAPAVDEALAAELPECRAYADDPDTFAYCAYSRIQQVRGLAEARRVCALAGTWQESCSEVWATDPRNCREDLDGLLSMCPTASCRFAVLDACPSEDVVAQSALCLERAGEFSECCTGHAGQRWLADEPDAHDIAAAMSFEGPHADVLGIWSALAMQDLGEGSCEDPPGDLAPTAGAVDGCTKTRLRCEDDPSYCSGLRKAKRGAMHADRPIGQGGGAPPKR